ncbi:hypothetical protein A9973_17520 [Achromobacter sp. UMC46]|nr:hypothetical protein [Achromobacter sp. UMC46]
MPKPLFAALLALAPFASPVLAAGMNCTLAKTPTERAICADAGLLRQDSDLSAAYAKLSAALPDGRAALRQDQRDWLRARNGCGADASCIRDQYLLRLSALQDMLRRATAYVPDETDRLALEDLRQAVEAASGKNAEFPLEDALAAIAVKRGMTTFSNVRANEDDDEARFPVKRPEGVTPDEWKALQASGIDAGGENGAASYTLMDLDGDGQRDLVIDSYTGGTGLFSDVGALRRAGGRFTEATGSDGDAVSGLYTLNGRGSNQASDWVRLHGRIYAAYRNSNYGVDQVYLLRPFHAVGEVPTLTIQYRYQLQVPRQQKRADKAEVRVLDDALHAGLTQALAKVDPEAPQGGGDSVNLPGAPDRPLCPIPDGVKDDERDRYYQYGAGHYSYETVADMAVHVGTRCYVARLIDWFGSYDAKNGLSAMIWLRPADADDGEEEVSVEGRRRAIRFGTSVGPI